jgi:hypothetical protein
MRLSWIPREQRFFDDFDAITAILSDAAEVFAKMVEHWEQPEKRASELRELEHQCDVAVGDLLTALGKTFITPLDREDIHSLATSLDTILDDMEEAAYRLVAYRVERPTAEAAMLAAIARQSVEALQKAVSLCRDQLASQEMGLILREISRLENEADEVFRTSLSKLFSDPPDAIDIIKWRDIYQALENTVDACRNTAHVISEIVAKGT